MEEDHVFKVPPVNKKRPSLYCRETLDGLDEIWRSAKKRTSITDNLHNSNTSIKEHSLRSNTRTKELSPMSCNDAETSGQLESAHENDNLHEAKYSSQNKYAYAVGLLHEFSKSSGCDHQRFCEEATQCDSGRSFNAQSRCPSKQQQQHATSGCSTSSQQQTGLGVGSTSSDGEDMSITPDVLIFRDESIAGIDSDSSGSDIDWDSLTPPAPRSPGDHTVPDLYDLGTITPPSDWLSYSYDHLASVQQTIPNRRQGGSSFNPAQQGVVHHLPMSALDHIVPDFYI